MRFILDGVWGVKDDFVDFFFGQFERYKWGFCVVVNWWISNLIKRRSADYSKVEVGQTIVPTMCSNQKRFFFFFRFYGGVPVVEETGPPRYYWKTGLEENWNDISFSFQFSFLWFQFWFCFSISVRLFGRKSLLKISAS